MSNKILNFIPQSFYDIIARILPGVVLLFCAYFIVYQDVTNFPAELKVIEGKIGSYGGGQYILILGIMLFAYFISIILEGIYFILNSTFRLDMALHKFVSLKFNVDKIKTKITFNHFEAICGRKLAKKIAQAKSLPVAVKLDKIRLLNPDAGSRLVKLRAECQMARIIVIGAIIMLYFVVVMTIFYSVEVQYSMIMSCGLLLILMVSFFWFFCDRYKYFLLGVHHHWILLNEKEILEKFDCIESKAWIDVIKKWYTKL